MPENRVIPGLGKKAGKEWNLFYNKCILEGGERKFCSNWADAQMEALGWYIDEEGNFRNDFIEADKASALQLKFKSRLKLDLDIENIKKQRLKNRKNSLFHKTMRGT